MANIGLDTTLRFEWRADGKQGKNVPIRHDELPNTGVPRPFVVPIKFGNRKVNGNASATTVK
jgi:hypothetical protein